MNGSPISRHAEPNVGVLSYDEASCPRSVEDCVVLGEESVVLLDRAVVASGKGIWLRPERCSLCRRTFVVVRTPETHDSIIRCPSCVRHANAGGPVVLNDLKVNDMVRISPEAKERADVNELGKRCAGKWGSIVRFHTSCPATLVSVAGFGSSEEIWFPIDLLERQNQK